MERNIPIIDMSTPTQKTLELLKLWKWYYWPVERFNSFSGRRSDLYNIIDYLVITEFSTIGVQSCGTDFSGHVNKLIKDEYKNTILWLSQKNRKLLLIGWRKVLVARGMRQRIFRPRIAWVYILGCEIIIDEKDTARYGKQKSDKRSK